MKNMKKLLAILMGLFLLHASFAFAVNIDVVVSADDDDAEEHSGGSIDRGSSDLELIREGDDQIVGIRFNSVNVPSGVVIDSAYLEFFVDETDDNDNYDGTLVIRGQAADDPSAFSLTSHDISSRPVTSAYTHWTFNSVNEWRVEHAAKQSPDIGPIVQEIVDRGGWSSNQAMVFIISGTSGTKRVAESRNGGGSSYAPRLHIEYHVPVGAVIHTDPTPLDVATYEGLEVNPATFQLSNIGTQDLVYSIGDAVSWMECDTNCSGTVTPGHSVPVTIIFTTDGYTTGSYTDHLTITAANTDNSPYNYNVNLTILPREVEIPGGASSDDAEEYGSGSVSVDSSDLEMIDGDGNELVGIRFPGITIPSGAVITNAYIEFTVDETGNSNGTLLIFGQDADDASTFTNTDSNISSRPKTSASVAWLLNSSNEWNTVGEKKQTPDISSVVQEIYDRSAWNSGNAMVFLIDGSGLRVANSYDEGGGPKLHIDFDWASSEISVTPEPLQLESCTGTGSVSGQFTLQNTGTADLQYSVAPDAGDTWLSCTNNCSGTISHGASETVGIAYDNTTMPAGTVTGHFTITATDGKATNSPYSYVVDLSTITCSQIAVTPTPLVANDTLEGINADPATFTLTNNGDEVLTYSVSDNSDWFSCSASSACNGTLSIGASVDIDVMFTNASLSAGTYTGQITVEETAGTATNSPFVFDVQLTVNPSSNISVPDSLQVAAPVGFDAETTTFPLTNSGSADLVYTITDDGSGWFACSGTACNGTLAAGDTVDVEVTFSSSALANGSYSGQFTIAGDAATRNTPVQYQVNLEVEPYKARISVDPDPFPVVETFVGVNADSTTFELTNTSWHPMVYTIEPDVDWLQCDPCSGTLNKDESATINVTFNDTSDLEINTYSGNFTITAEETLNSPFVYEVPLLVNEEPGAHILTSGGSIIAESDEGSNADPASFVITNDGAAELSYYLTIPGGETWFSCTSNCGTESNMITLQPDETATVGVQFTNYDMAPGTYTGSFEIISSQASNSPVDYNVNLLINEVALGETCGDVPIYAQDLVDPAILVLLDVSSSMNSMVPNADVNQQTPDLKDVVQEIVDRNGWQSGNDMVFIISGTGSASAKRVAVSHDNEENFAPLLVVNYTSEGVSHELEVRVRQDNDDAEERVSNGDIYLSSSDLELIYDGHDQVVGIRFQDITIPSGAEITDAHISFTPDEFDFDETTYLRIEGEDVDDALVFNADDYNISQRPRTSQYVDWVISEPWTGNARYIVGREVISDLVSDNSVSWGYGTWAFTNYSGPSNDPDLSLLPGNPYGDDQIDLFTKIHAGVKHRNESETEELQSIIEATTTTGGTPFGPSILAAWQYFAGTKPVDGDSSDTYNSTLTCQPKFLIEVTDGEGYRPHTTVDIVEQYVNLLYDNSISGVAVGFGIDSATQINQFAQTANSRGSVSSTDDLYALHNTNDAGVGVPFLAQTREELKAALENIVDNVKRQIFIGSAPAPSTSVDAGSFVVSAEFNAATWEGNIKAIPYSQETGALMICVDSNGNKTCDLDNIVGKCIESSVEGQENTCGNNPVVEGTCLCWDACVDHDNDLSTPCRVLPETKSAWTVAGPNSDNGSLAEGEVGAYVDTVSSDYQIAIPGDNYMCRDLGDIIASTPVIVESPRNYYQFDGYSSFKFGAAENRDKMLYVGANDGALHAFKLNTGVEKWRFYPEAVQLDLSFYDICSEDYCHRDFVNATPYVADVYTISGWRTMLMSGLGGGGSAYFALDITSANTFAENGTDPLTNTTYLWQFEDDELGLTAATPTIARVSESSADFGGWGAFFGSGYAENGNPLKEAYLYGIEAYSGEDLWGDSSDTYNRIKLEQVDRIYFEHCDNCQFSNNSTVTGSSSGANGVISSVHYNSSDNSGYMVFSSHSGTFVDGERLQVGDIDVVGDDSVAVTVDGSLRSAYESDALSDPLVADLDFDQVGDALYVGNLYGRMYRVDSIGKSQDPVVHTMFDLNASGTVNKNMPIRAGAAFGYDSAHNTIWLYFGSGKFEDQADKENDSQQYFVGLKDNLATPVSNSHLSDLLPRTAVSVTANSKEYRVITGFSFQFQSDTGVLTPGLTMTGVDSNAVGVVSAVDTTNHVVTFSAVSGSFKMGETIESDDGSVKVKLQNHPWSLRLTQTTGVPSERVVAKPLVAGGVVFFTSFVPDTDVCGGNGSAWLYALDYETGLPPTEPVFDINGDGAFTEADVVGDSGMIPGAIPIGRGIPSAPVLKDNMIFVNTTDARQPGIKVNLPLLRAAIKYWNDKAF